MTVYQALVQRALGESSEYATRDLLLASNSEEYSPELRSFYRYLYDYLSASGTTFTEADLEDLPSAQDETVAFATMSHLHKLLQPRITAISEAISSTRKAFVPCCFYTRGKLVEYNGAVSYDANSLLEKGFAYLPSKKTAQEVIKLLATIDTSKSDESLKQMITLYQRKLKSLIHKDFPCMVITLRHRHEFASVIDCTDPANQFIVEPLTQTHVKVVIL